MITKLLAVDAELTTSSVGRFRRFAATAMRGGRLALLRGLRGGSESPFDFNTLSKMVSSVGELKGVTMKMGQILSYIDVALPEDTKEVLSALQTHAQPMPLKTVQKVVRQELPIRATDLLNNLDAEPVGAASIGQVHRSRLATGKNVAVKVQYPGIERAIAKDFGPAAIGGHIAALVYPGTKIDAFVREARYRFLEECDYTHEAACQKRFADIYKGHETLLIPEVYPEFSSSKVLTTAFIEGQYLSAYLENNPAQKERDRMGRALFEFYIGSLFSHGVYNCDPHPGNYLFMNDGRLAMLDHGCTREFEPEMVTRLADLSAAVLADSREALHTALLGLGIVKANKKYDYDAARSLLRSFYGPMLRDEVLAFADHDGLKMRKVTQNKGEIVRLGLPGEFLFLLRIRFGLASVLARLGSRANWFRLEGEYVRAHQEEVAEKRNPHIFDVAILTCGEEEVQIIREVRDALGIELKDARDLLSTVPRTIKRGLTREEAMALCGRFEVAGGRAEIDESVQGERERYPGATSEPVHKPKKKRSQRGASRVSRRR